MTPTELKAKTQSMIQRNPVYGEIVTWMGGLLAETMAQQPGPPPWKALPGAAAPAPGRPLIALRDLPLDLDFMGGLWERLVERVGAHAGDSAQLNRLRRLPSQPGALAGLAAALLSGDADRLEREAGNREVDPDLLGLLMRMALRPSLLALAAGAGPVIKGRPWGRGYCPVCGSDPRLAELTEDSGLRLLHCSWCETAWSHARLTCPFCGNDDPQKLSYLQAEEEEGLRVDICYTCGRYLKTMDSRELREPVSVPLDDAATLHLDLMAREHLYAVPHPEASL